MSSVRALTAVFQRELVERRMLFAAALVLGLMPLLVPVLPRLGSGSLSDVRGATALAVAAIFGSVVALVLGGSVIARDLAERRISFYFSRPLPGWTIWAGKLTAGAALAVGGAALVLVPALLMGDKLDPSGYWGGNVADTGESFFWAIGAMLLLLLAGHAIGVILRSRSPWLILDLVAFLVAGWLLLDSTHTLGVVGARTVFTYLATGLLYTIPIALLAASVVQVIRGRTDLRRSHRLLSLTLWGILLSLALVALGVKRWVVSATPRDLANVSVALSAPVGDWVFLEGRAAHRGDYKPAFLIDTASGKFVNLPPYQSDIWWVRSTFSADGRRAAWAHPANGSVGIATVDLTRPETGVVLAPISFDAYLEDLALSPDGRRLATVVRGRLQVDEFPSGRMLASVTVPWDWRQVNKVRLLFGESAIRIYAVRHDLLPGKWDRTKPTSFLEIYEYDLARKELTQTGQLDFHSLVWDLANNDDATRLVLRNPATDMVEVHDARTGEVRMTYPVPPDARFRAVLLTENRLALTISKKGGSELLVLDGDGAPLRRLRFAQGVFVGGQPTSDSLVLAAQDAVWLLDLDSGKVKRLAQGLMPAMSAPANPPGSTATKLFVGDKGRLVWIDPATGRQKVVLAGQG